MMKRWLLFLLSVLILAVFAYSCGEGIDNDNSINETTDTPPTVSSGTATSNETPGFIQNEEEEVEVATTIETSSDFPADAPVTSGQCDDQQGAGYDTPEVRVIEMGKSSGTFTFSYQTYRQEDQMFVLYEGAQLFDTTCLGTGNYLTENITYSGTSTQMTVQIVPNCVSGSGTAWAFSITCPQ
ncbi:MAG: hypothetical protein HQM14_01630 [SAR324 cluster bacterium]|nr:hypothetical protein [SAR324 cluster bacterium]